jgi:hypothetical protein
MARAIASFESDRGACHRHSGLRHPGKIWIDLGDFGVKDHVAAVCLGQGEVLLKRTWIALEIGGIVELQRVHEDRTHHKIALCSRSIKK